VAQLFSLGGFMRMKIVVRGISLLGSAFWIVVLVIASRFGNWGDGAGSYQPNPYAYLLYGAPFIYFAIAFGTTFARRRGIAVLSTGIVSHLILASFVAYFFITGTTGVMFAVPSVFCALMWGFMYFSLGHEPAA
jgi:hypothetical protein